MSVFSFGKTDEVWGFSRSTTMGMIDWWIDHAGPRPYLLKIKQSYDHGYNHGNLAEVSDDDKAELRDLVMAMLETGYERELRQDDHGAKLIREGLSQLWRLLNADLEGTSYHRKAELSK